jgi:hypothetical protein
MSFVKVMISIIKLIDKSDSWIIVNPLMFCHWCSRVHVSVSNRQVSQVVLKWNTAYICHLLMNDIMSTPQTSQTVKIITLIMT